MPTDDDHLTVGELIAHLQDFPDHAPVRVACGDGRGWPGLSTPLVHAYLHPGAPGEGAYCCLEIWEEWSENR